MLASSLPPLPPRPHLQAAAPGPAPLGPSTALAPPPPSATSAPAATADSVAVPGSTPAAPLSGTLPGTFPSTLPGTIPAASLPGSTPAVPAADATSTSTSTPPTDGRNPWPLLQRAHLLMTAGVVPGPVGASLDAQAREGLLDVLTRLDAHGAHLFEAGQKDQPPRLLTPSESLARIEQGPAIFEHPLLVGDGQQQPVPVDNLLQLQVLAGLHLGTPVDDSANPALVHALAGLHESGWQVFSSEVPRDVLQAWRQGAGIEGAKGGRLRAPDSIPGRVEDFEIYANQENIALVDFFYGSGNEDGVKNVALARSLKDLAHRGYVFRQRAAHDVFRPEHVHGALGGYNSYSTIGISRGDGPYLLMPLDLIDDPDAAERFIHAAEQMQQALPPAPPDAAISNEVLVLSVCRHYATAPLDERLTLSRHLQALVAAEDHAPGRDEKADVLALAQDDLRRLQEWTGRTPTAGVPALLARYERLLSIQPRAEALETMEWVQRGLRARVLDGAEHEEMTRVYWHLLDQVQQPKVARESFDLLEIPTGAESLEDRLRLFDEIAARESETTLSSAPQDYRTVLAQRLPDESLLEAGQRFVSVLAGLGAGRQQGRAAEVFTTIQKMAARGSQNSTAEASNHADALAHAFLSAYLLSRDVDVALDRMRHPAPPASAGGISGDEGAVTIGGVKVPVRR